MTKCSSLLSAIGGGALVACSFVYPLGDYANGEPAPGSPLGDASPPPDAGTTGDTGTSGDTGPPGPDAGVLMRPTGDVTLENVVGVDGTGAPVTSNLYVEVDDPTADDSTTYVRGDPAIATSSHTASYSGAPAGTVTSVIVSYRAQRGSADGTAQVLLYDGATLIGTGAARTQGAWTDFSDAFSGLNVTSANNLRTKIVFQNTAAIGALRYTQIGIRPTFSNL